MKFKKRYITIFVPALAILAIAGAFAAIPGLRGRFINEESKPLSPVASNKNPDKKAIAIVHELIQVVKGLDSLTTLSFKGSMSVNDLADSTNNLVTDFEYTRQGTLGYYKMGDNETLSARDVYLVVVHSAKKIFLSEPVKMENPMKVQLPKESELLEEEGYKVSRSVKDSLIEISLVNSTHATCREYSILFDGSGGIHHVRMRLADANAMSNSAKDKKIEINIDNWQVGVVRQELLRTDRYISAKNGEPKPVGALQDYEIIKD
ncbi:hypothetical protein SAMN05428949_0398 [Chitinophaga sp. YR627]|uniref:hypothetical protein n=1 Tax=Chitinophaga sp. YR627 TaxID=1881041 RepID=UPI0008F2DF6A|nr:hypothetical protein [Chitinophaga sp. YR627]SFM67600.1 hypothetical protein SAMN05428949_0398 [Chitinophaga sp. YR627]